MIYFSQEYIVKPRSPVALKCPLWWSTLRLKPVSSSYCDLAQWIRQLFSFGLGGCEFKSWMFGVGFFISHLLSSYSTISIWLVLITYTSIRKPIVKKSCSYLLWYNSKIGFRFSGGEGLMSENLIIGFVPKQAGHHPGFELGISEFRMRVFYPLGHRYH